MGFGLETEQIVTDSRFIEAAERYLNDEDIPEELRKRFQNTINNEIKADIAEEILRTAKRAKGISIPVPDMP